MEENRLKPYICEDESDSELSSPTLLRLEEEVNKLQKKSEFDEFNLQKKESTGSLIEEYVNTFKKRNDDEHSLDESI